VFAAALARPESPLNHTASIRCASLLFNATARELFVEHAFEKTQSFGILVATTKRVFGRNRRTRIRQYAKLEEPENVSEYFGAGLLSKAGLEVTFVFELRRRVLGL
jgi:hypothetical protein